MPVCVKTGQGFNNRDGFRFVHSVGNWLFAAEVTFSLCSNEFRTLQHAQLMLVHSCDETFRPEAFFVKKKKPTAATVSPPIPAHAKTPLISSPASLMNRQKKRWAQTKHSTSCLIKTYAGQTVESVCASR